MSQRCRRLEIAFDPLSECSVANRTRSAVTTRPGTKSGGLDYDGRSGAGAPRGTRGRVFDG
jgi:hypothetical protein